MVLKCNSTVNENCKTDAEVDLFLGELKNIKVRIFSESVGLHKGSDKLTFNQDYDIMVKLKSSELSYNKLFMTKNQVVDSNGFMKMLKEPNSHIFVNFIH